MSGYKDLQQFKADIISFGIKFKCVKKRPTEEQVLRGDTAFWLDRKFMCKEFPSSGVLYYGQKFIKIRFGADCPIGEECDITKHGLKAALFSRTKCGICMKLEPLHSVPCFRCGFTICPVCRMKLAMQTLTPITAEKVISTTIACPKCRLESKYSILESINSISSDFDEFDGEDQTNLRHIKRAYDQFGPSQNSHFFNKYGSDGSFSLKDKQKAGEMQSQMMKDQMDQSKCASCKKSFVSKRSNCGACGKVSYCNKKCQTNHWKMHKKLCKVFKRFESDEQ